MQQQIQMPRAGNVPGPRRKPQGNKEGKEREWEGVDSSLLGNGRRTGF